MSQLTPFPYIALFNPRAQTTRFRGFKKEKNEKKKAIQLSQKHKREASKEGRQGEENETRGKIQKEVGRQEKGEKRKKIKGAKKGMRARKMQRSFYNEPKLHPSFTFKSIVQILSVSFVKVVCVAKGSQSVLLPRPTRVCAVLPRPPRPSKIRVETFVEARLWEHSCDWLSPGSLTGLIPRDGLRQLSPIRLKIIIQFMNITVSINFICYFKTPSCPPASLEDNFSRSDETQQAVRSGTLPQNTTPSLVPEGLHPALPGISRCTWAPLCGAFHLWITNAGGVPWEGNSLLISCSCSFHFKIFGSGSRRAG